MFPIADDEEEEEEDAEDRAELASSASSIRSDSSAGQLKKPRPMRTEVIGADEDGGMARRRKALCLWGDGTKVQ